MDVQTAATLADLRQQLDAARREIDFLRGFANNPDVERLRGERDAARQALNENDLELAKAMIRADVLAAEVKAWRDISSATTADAIEVAAFTLSDARAATDRTNALDPAKFEEQP